MATEPQLNSEMKWHVLPWAVPRYELYLPTTLNSGQSFRWIKLCSSITASDTPVASPVPATDHQAVYSTALQGYWIALKQDLKKNQLLFQTNGPLEKVQDLLKDYFQLETPLLPLFEDWASRDDHFKTKAFKSFQGLRILR